ncbi:MAG: hypothetical protein IPL58_10175 [Betaproteobacteria bacterium]|uniref:Uncharacterized protein n=1 Tax=Candidatus Proximibacter danicus TaxID=2954365 RepID=A0A9D7PQR7_9PROT|nr:hypothetical protein [Candidatus Proximibacter danicus]
MTSTPLLYLTARASLARPFLFAGAVLLMLDGSAIAQTPIKAEKTKRTLIVSDAVQLSGSKISGGWREHAVDGSWRSVTFVLGDNVATVTFGDGEKGRRAPSATRYVYAGPGGKAAKAGDAPAVYSETHVLADATPGILGKANQSSQVPADVATRIRELGGDIKLMQQAADLKRISELGSALDAAASRAADDRFFGDRPGGPPRRSGGGWKDPRAGVGRDGRAGDDVVIFEKAGTDEHGNYAYTIVTRHDDGSTTTDSGFRDTSGGTATTSEHKDASGRVTGGSQDTSGGPGGGSSSAVLAQPRHRRGDDYRDSYVSRWLDARVRNHLVSRWQETHGREQRTIRSPLQRPWRFQRSVDGQIPALVHGCRLLGMEAQKRSEEIRRHDLATGS